jgi:hypothetical protein
MSAVSGVDLITLGGTSGIFVQAEQVINVTLVRTVINMTVNHEAVRPLRLKEPQAGLRPGRPRIPATGRREGCDTIVSCDEPADSTIEEWRAWSGKKCNTSPAVAKAWQT